MRPSEVREKVLADHERLRSDFVRIEALARAVRDGALVRFSDLRVEGDALLARLLTHMRWEESYLLPALREADSWGAERAARLIKDHRDQRELFRFFHSRLGDTEAWPVLARRLTDLIALLRDDMAEEERDLLDERVLRDDVVAVDALTG
jgi:Hemerythrin HHE cation binding domain